MSQQHCSSMQFTAKHTAKTWIIHSLKQVFFPGFEIRISTVHWEGFLVFQIFSWQTLPGRPGLGDCKIFFKPSQYYFHKFSSAMQTGCSMPPFITTWHHHRFGAPFFPPKKGRKQEIDWRLREYRQIPVLLESAPTRWELDGAIWWRPTVETPFHRHAANHQHRNSNGFQYCNSDR